MTYTTPPNYKKNRGLNLNPLTWGKNSDKNSSKSNGIGTGKQPNKAGFLKRNGLLMAMIAALIWIPGLFYTYNVFKPVYQSTATVLIKNTAITAQYVTNTTTETTSSPSANPVFNTIELLKSHVLRKALWERLVSKSSIMRKKLKIETELDWNQAYGDGSTWVKYKNPPGTDVVYLSFTSDDPYIAQKGLDIVVHAFQDASRQLNQEEYASRAQFLTKQIVQVQNNLNGTRDKITRIKQANNVIDIDRQLEQYSHFDLQYKMESAIAKAEAASNTQKLKAYRKTLGMSPEQAVKAVGIGQNMVLQRMHEGLYEQTQNLAQLKERYTDEHPKVRNLKAQISKMQANISAEARRMGISPKTVAVTDDSRGRAIGNMIDARSAAEGAAQKAAILSQSVGDLESRMRRLPAVQASLHRLQDTEQILSDTLRSLESQAVDAQLRKEQTLSNVFIIAEPEAPDKPMAPTRNQLTLMTLLAGLVGALGAGSIKDTLRSKLTVPGNPLSGDGTATTTATDDDVLLDSLLIDDYALEHRQTATSTDATH
jgi:uncharacterized protein involved in exopolysaccharide biosynthesis